MLVLRFGVLVMAVLVLGAGQALPQTTAPPTPAPFPAATAGLPQADAALPAVLSTSATYRLWSVRAPGATSDAASETPTITVFRPWRPQPNGPAVVIAPGGGYIGLAGSLEGVEPAAWFAARGVTAFVLTYRVGDTARLPRPLFDGARAVRYVRARALEFGVDPNRIGMLGFSAGGHLAASTAVDATPGDGDAADPIERVSSRPDFLILLYPWLEATAVRRDGGSQYCDFARRAGSARCVARDYERFAPTGRVSANTPPTFIYHTTNDALVPIGGSMRFFEALEDHGVPAEFHAFESGPHGTGLGGADESLSQWPNLLQAWLRHRGVI